MIPTAACQGSGPPPHDPLRERQQGLSHGRAARPARTSPWRSSAASSSSSSAPSGSGKSTLLRLVLKEERATGGTGPRRRPGARPPAQPQGPGAAPRDRHRLPGLPAAAEQDRLPERRLRPAGARPLAPRRSAQPCPRRWRWSAWTARRSACRTSCPVASSSASRSPGRSSTSRRSCSATSPPATSTPPPASTSCGCSTGSTAPAPPS